MDPEIRRAVIEQFSEFPLRNFSDVVKDFVQKKHMDDSDAVRTLHWMTDAGEIDSQGERIRLTLKGKQSTAPLHSRIISYIVMNWLAIAALALSAASTVIAVIALRKP